MTKGLKLRTVGVGTQLVSCSGRPKLAFGTVGDLRGLTQHLHGGTKQVPAKRLFRRTFPSLGLAVSMFSSGAPADVRLQCDRLISTNTPVTVATATTLAGMGNNSTPFVFGETPTLRSNLGTNCTMHDSKISEKGGFLGTGNVAVVYLQGDSEQAKFAGKGAVHGTHFVLPRRSQKVLSSVTDIPLDASPDAKHYWTQGLFEKKTEPDGREKHTVEHTDGSARMVFYVEDHIGDWGPRIKYRELFKLGEKEKLIWGLQQLNQVPGGLGNRLEQVVRRSCIGDIAGMGRMEVQAIHGPYAATLRDAVGFLPPAEGQEANQQPQEVRFSGPNEAFNVSIDCVSFAPLE